MEIKLYDTMPPEAGMIRKLVFVEEQGFEDEFDEVDACAHHLVMFDGDKPIATCRFFAEQGTRSYVIGWIAVIKDYRGQKIGAKLMQAAEEIVRKENGETMILHSQMQAKGFYEKQGYLPYREADLEQGCPHIWMAKKMNDV